MKLLEQASVYECEGCGRKVIIMPGDQPNDGLCDVCEMWSHRPKEKKAALMITELERNLQEALQDVHEQTGIIIKEVLLKSERDTLETLYYDIKFVCYADDYSRLREE